MQKSWMGCRTPLLHLNKWKKWKKSNTIAMSFMWHCYLKLYHAAYSQTEMSPVVKSLDRFTILYFDDYIGLSNNFFLSNVFLDSRTRRSQLPYKCLHYVYINHNKCLIYWLHIAMYSKTNKYQVLNSLLNLKSA